MVQWIENDVKAAVYGGIVLSFAMTLNLWFYGRNTNMTAYFNSFIRGKRDALFFWKFCFFFGFLSIPILIWYNKGLAFNIGN
jgi:hypothetical protein